MQINIGAIMVMYIIEALVKSNRALSDTSTLRPNPEEVSFHFGRWLSTIITSGIKLTLWAHENTLLADLTRMRL
jgi:hypothetical protein